MAMPVPTQTTDVVDIDGVSESGGKYQKNCPLALHLNYSSISRQLLIVRKGKLANSVTPVLFR